MLSTLLLIASLCSAEPPADPPDGTLIFLKNTSYVVEAVTQSRLTHTAIIFHRDGVPWVYEANLPIVHRMTLEDYWGEFPNTNPVCVPGKIAGVQIRFCTPKTPYTPDEVRDMRRWAERELGKKYRILSYVSKHVGGEHCSGFATMVLCRSGRYSLVDFNVERANRVSPEILWETVKKDYNEGEWFSQDQQPPRLRPKPVPIQN